MTIAALFTLRNSLIFKEEWQEVARAFVRWKTSRARNRFVVSGSDKEKDAMLRKLTVIVAMVSVAACSTVIDERRSSIVVDGKTFPLVTQTIQSGDRTYEVTYVIAKNERRLCIPDSPGDCEGAAKESRRSGDR